MDEELEVSQEDLAAFQEAIGGEEVPDSNEVIPEEAPPKEETEKYQPKNDVEEEVLQHGWKPKEQWISEGNDPDDWVGPSRFKKEYDRIKEIRALRDQVETTDRHTKQMLEHVKQTSYEKAQAEYQEKLEELRTKRWQALEEGDLDKARQAEQQEDALRNKPPEVVDPDAIDPRLAPVFTPWKEQNSWYDRNKDPETWQKATAYGQALMQMGTPYADVLRSVADQFAPKPEKPEPRRPASPVETPRPTRQPRASTGFKELSPETRATFRELARLGMAEDTEEGRKQYAQECVRRGET